ncbi:unnamed protein product [Cyberlindnera jadinii]|uniref:Genetic interactor of prohibitins 3, mitochondrial n=1 Tax=Cyberlindnera jadinii (strain ATCC 18201 / CBS 1600 / BCRC 20928 / JCM 3617 / NBRC 0987 / NRRL Y-1542) TaxID=983966 RepID=A0A0H5C6Z5_CYBJN|nr:unnamed protein product [Cyberlindnera jadinii]
MIRRYICARGARLVFRGSRAGLSRQLSTGKDDIRVLAERTSTTVDLDNTNVDSITHDLVPQCASCGIQLQSSDADEIGYYKEPANKPKAYNSKRLQFLSAYAQLDQEGRRLLAGEDADARAKQEPVQEPVQEKVEELVCLRCHNALHHNVYKVNEHQPMNMHEVLSPIPLNHQIINVFSAYDFPLSLVPLSSRKNVTYAMNKVDLLAGHKSFVNKYSSFFAEMLKRFTGSKNLVVVSGHTSWGVLELLKKLGNVNYLVGYVNTGKTRLANRLWNSSVQLSSPGAKNVDALGSSHLPSLTRDNIVHKCNQKKVIDTPGFLNHDNVYSLIQEQSLKHTLKGQKILVNDLKTATYITVRGGQCYTSGGLFFLVPPKNSMVQVIPVCQGVPKVFSSVEKAISVVRAPPEALKDTFVVKQDAMDDLVRYVIPPFYGSVDLLVKDIGYVQITPTGRKQNDDLFEVWAPRGVVLGVRETIEHFMTRYLKKIKTKTIRKPGTTEQKHSLKMKAKPIPDYKVFSRLYEVPRNCLDTMEEVKAQYETHIAEYGSSYNKWSKNDRRDETRNKYWIEKV